MHFYLSNLYTFYFFFFLATLHWLEPPVQFWTEAVGADFLALFPFLEENNPVVCHQVKCYLHFFCRCPPSSWWNPSAPSLLTVFCSVFWMDIGFCSGLFCLSWDIPWFSSFSLVNCIDWFLNLKPIFHFFDKSQFVMMYLFYMSGFHLLRFVSFCVCIMKDTGL